MKLGIMQPYFFPYLGYFAIIENTDKFIFFDTSQYIHHGWVNRNRVLNSKNGTSYIVVPVKKAGQKTAIMDMEIDNTQKWKEKIWGLLTVYKKKAPFYKETIEILHDILDKDYISLSTLNIEATEKVCNYIGIGTIFDTYSKMNLTVPEVKAPDEWALYITLQQKFDTYVNPPGGIEFFDREKYNSHSIALEFLQLNFREYCQKIGRFEKGLSVVDVLMFCKPCEIKDMLHDYEIIKEPGDELE